jgi:AraC-like DNA-binding protein/quercetin dioxygenase-like cupin family protein
MDRNLYENRIHGNAAFPLDVYQVRTTGGHLFPCHCHDELELTLVQAGKVSFQVDAKWFAAGAGQAVFVNSRELHAAYPAENASGVLEALVFSPNLLAGPGYDGLQERFIMPLLRKEYRPGTLIRGESDWQQELLTHLAEIITLNRVKPFTYELLIKARLFKIAALLIANSQRTLVRTSEAQRRQLSRIKTILQYIQTHYQQKISIKDLAAMENVSEAHFCRVFKQITRTTPLEYINCYRIRKAAQLLTDDQRKIIDIAMDVGFENFSYFIKTFKHYLQFTPSQYRKTHQKPPLPDSPGFARRRRAFKLKTQS